MTRRYSAEQKRLLEKIEKKFIRHITPTEDLEQALRLQGLVQRGKFKAVLKILDRWA